MRNISAFLLASLICFFMIGRVEAVDCPRGEQRELRAVICGTGSQIDCARVKAAGYVGDIEKCRNACFDCKVKATSVEDDPSGPVGDGSIPKNTKKVVRITVNGVAQDVTLTALEDLDSFGEYTIGSPQVSSDPKIPAGQYNVMFFYSLFECEGTC